MITHMRLKTFHVWLMGLGMLGAGVYGLMAPASAQAPQGPVSFSGPRPAPAPVAPSAMPSAPTQMQALLDSAGRTVLADEYRVGETQAPGAVANAEEAPFSPPTRVRFSAVVVYERGREDQRIKGLKVTIERPQANGQTQEFVSYVDRGEMQGLVNALNQLTDGARREGRESGRDFGRDDRRRAARVTARSSSYTTADFAVTVRAEGGRPVIEVRNPNRPDSRVILGADAAQATLDQWTDWIGSAHLLLERK